VGETPFKIFLCLGRPLATCLACKLPGEGGESRLSRNLSRPKDSAIIILTSDPRPSPRRRCRRDGDGGVGWATETSGLKVPEPVSGGECGVVRMSSRMSTVALVSRSKFGDGRILPGVGRNSSSSSLVADPEQIGALCRRADEAKGFSRAWRLDLGVTERCWLDEDFEIVGTGYNAGFSSSVSVGRDCESKRIWKG